MSNGYTSGVMRLNDSAIGTILLILLVYTFTASLAIAGGQHDQEASHHEPGGMHRHDTWVTPPDSYHDKAINRWDDKAAAEKGKKLYEQYCLQCHGVDGKGTGPLASSLEHAPADLTNHFHQSPGNGDAYLYWRVSEGGMVEPFVSMKSAMPSFKMNLSEADRWDVLIYVHQTFHKSFLNSKDGNRKDEHMGHQH